jgi:hypothetical protein
MCKVLLPPGVKTIAIKKYITPYNYRMKQPTSSKNMGFYIWSKGVRKMLRMAKWKKSLRIADSGGRGTEEPMARNVALTPVLGF